MATGWGFFTAMIGMTSFHDAKLVATKIFISLAIGIIIFSHFAITHKPWVWNVVGTFHDFYLGNSMIVWINQVSVTLLYTLIVTHFFFLYYSMYWATTHTPI